MTTTITVSRAWVSLVLAFLTGMVVGIVAAPAGSLPGTTGELPGAAPTAPPVSDLPAVADRRPASTQSTGGDLEL